MAPLWHSGIDYFTTYDNYARLRAHAGARNDHRTIYVCAKAQFTPVNYAYATGHAIRCSSGCPMIDTNIALDR